MEPLLSIEHVSKYYGENANVTKALDDVCFTVESGEFVGIMGASGSGKTTMLQCISTLDEPTGGRILLDKKDITKLSEREIAHFRSENLGFVFQEYNLLDTLTLGTLILVDVPMIEERNDKDWYGTIPLGIIVTDKMIFTVCLEDTQVLTRFMEGRVRNFFTYMKTRFILQILYRNSSMYLRYLRIIDKKSEQVEEKLHFSPRNQELIELLELEKSLVYFTTSLRSNEAVLEKLIKLESIKKYPEDTELLEDVIIENTQAFRTVPGSFHMH